METNFQTESESLASNETKETNPLSKVQQGMLVIGALGFILALGIIIGLININAKLNEKITMLEKKVESSTSDLEAKVSNAVQLANGAKDQIDGAIKAAYYLTLSHFIEGGVVTDNFIAEKVIFYPEDNRVLLDLEGQPSMSYKHLGQGRFELKDRELKSMVQEIVLEVGESYSNAVQSRIGEFPKWSELTVLVTYHNYDLGTYQNGEFKLTGE
jgi:hypothetical protein